MRAYICAGAAGAVSVWWVLLGGWLLGALALGLGLLVCVLLLREPSAAEDEPHTEQLRRLRRRLALGRLRDRASPVYDEERGL